MATHTLKTMEDLVKQHEDDLVPFKTGDVIEGKIIAISLKSVIVEIENLALGLIPEKEFSYDIDDLSVGDKVLAYVIMPENEDGYVILSMKRADRERVWQALQEKLDSGDPMKIKIVAANRGGLMGEFGGIEGFIPVSQLSAQHYPKVEGGDQDKILNRLRQLVKNTLEVKVITLDRANNKLIFSEKALGDEKVNQLAESLSPGEAFEAKITGIVDFGLFVSINLPKKQGMIEGLVHISEIAWERVDDLRTRYAVGDEVEVKVIGVKNGRVSLSIKQLLPDPWETAVKKLAVGDKVKGEVTRVTLFGAFVHLAGGIDGLVHVSELGKDITDPKSVVEEGKSYQFTIISIEPDVHRISLSLKTKNSKQSAKISKKPAAKKIKKTTKSSRKKTE